MTTLQLTTKITDSIKPALRYTILSLAEVALLAGCSSAPPTVVHQTVGPSLVGSAKADNGFLMVYSATAWTSLNDDGPSQLNHTDYEVKSSAGTLVEKVNNSDEEPSRVTLPKGNYTVVADSDTSGTVTVPVRIEAARTTVLHLERQKDWMAPAAIRGIDLVRLTNGQPIGFRASPPKSVKRSGITIAQLNE